MDARLQRRVQRYGWDLAADGYEPLWRSQLSRAQVKALECASPAPGERVLDVACGTGMVAFAAARAVGPRGAVVGVDLSGQMIEACRRRADVRRVMNARFERMDAESLSLPDASFDAAMCSLGLMYMPDPTRALQQMRRVLRPGGRLAVAVWGERSQCGWAPLFPIVDAEVESEVCPLFFRLGQGNTLSRICAEAGFEAIGLHRITTTMDYADEDEACNAAFVGGPVALAWSRFDDVERARVRRRYLEAISPWQHGRGFRIPGEFVVASAIAPSAPGSVEQSIQSNFLTD